MLRNVKTSVEIISDESRLETVVNLALTEPRVAIDLEADGFYHYPERVCLLQLGISDGVYLIDTLSLSEVTPLGELLADDKVEKIVHSGDYDIRSLDRDWGFRLRNLFDTSIGAAFLGSERRGLAAVLLEYLNIKINKEKKLQRADWSRRPLSQELLWYAAGDVLHLDRLREVLYRKLGDQGRIKWVQEEFQRLANVVYTPPDAKWGFLSIKGTSRLDGRGLAVLSSIYKYRENEALRRNLPPFKILSNAMIVELATNPGSDLSQFKGIGRYGNGSASSGLRLAIRDGLKALPIKRPPTRVRCNSQFKIGGHNKARERLRLLKEWRAKQATCFELDGGLLWPMASLERLSRRPDRFEEELTSNVVRQWQIGVFGESLQKFIKSIG